MKIHTIGDSHSYFGWPSYICKHHLGPVLCYNIDKKNIEFHCIKEGDAVIFCLGEIDCRCHIYKYIQKNPNIIDEIIDNYFQTIEKLTKDKKIKIFIYNVVPPVKKIQGNFDFPFLGTDEERRNYTLYFNKKCKEYCRKYNYNFFDTYDNYIDENGFLKEAETIVHIPDYKYNHIFICENITKEYL